MMRFLVCLLALGAATALQEQANPIRRVVNLLQNLQKEVQKEGEKEKHLYDKFMCYCKGNTDDLRKSIEDGESQSAQLSSDVKAKTAQKEQMDQELVEHKNDRKEAQEAIAKATTIREKENSIFLKQSGDQKTYVDALNKAIPAIEKGMGRSFIQVPHAVEGVKRAVMAASNVADMDKETVLSFLSSPYGNYNPASGEIVGILKTMKDDINKDLGGIIGDEEKAQKDFDELVAAKNQEIKAASAAIEKKSVRSGELAVEITEDKNAGENAARERAANKEFLANLASDCETKTSEWEERTKTRNEELVAISEAIKVLNDDDALDIFKKTLPSPAGPQAASFLQRSGDSKSARRAEAYAWIQSASTVSENRNTQLSLLAHMLRVAKVDFSKVLTMIDEMVAHLKKEQQTDDSQREWCGAEFERTDDQKKDLHIKIKDLNSQVDEDQASIKTLEEEIETLKHKISELDGAVKEATEQRKEEHAEFVQTSAELTAAVQLIEKATNRLNKFYNPALYKEPPKRELSEEERIAQNLGEELPTAAPQMIAGTNIAVNFLQLDDKPEAAPGTWKEGGYQKKGQKSGGILALMAMLQKDLDTQMLEGKKDEETAQRDYERLMEDSATTRKQDSKSLADDEANKANAHARLGSAKQDRLARVAELEGTNKEISNLHGSCDFLTENYAFRKEARGKEQESLVNAKAVLSGASYE